MDTRSSSQSALDVAAALIEAHPGLDQMQLHKLLYLVQAASLSWFDEPAFDEPIQAWIYGPVTRQVAGQYKQFGPLPITRPVTGDSARLSEHGRYVVKRIVDDFGNINGFALADQVKAPGSPWRQIRGDLPEDEPSQREIPRRLIAEYHRRNGVQPVNPSPEAAALAQEYLEGDKKALAELFERETGVRPSISPG